MFLAPHIACRFRSGLALVLPWTFVLTVVAVALVASGQLPWLRVKQQNPVINQVPSDEISDRFSRTGSRHSVTVLRTIDGDTFEARAHVWPGMEITTRVRLRGIDAPELKANCAQELRMAEAATAALAKMLAEGDVIIFNIGPDKYAGRVVADAATKKTPNVSNAMLDTGLARPYLGGRREAWCPVAGMR